MVDGRCPKGSQGSQGSQVDGWKTSINALVEERVGREMLRSCYYYARSKLCPAEGELLYYWNFVASVGYVMNYRSRKTSKRFF
jgi:hypothetical protein